MRKITVLLIIFTTLSFAAKAQMSHTDSVFEKDLRAATIACIQLSIDGLKAIRYDDILRWRFRAAHRVKLEYRKEELLLQNQQTK